MATEEGKRHLPRSPGRRSTDRALPATWDAKTAEEVARRLEEHHERLDAVEHITEALAGDVHSIRKSFEAALSSWREHIETDAKRRASEADDRKREAADQAQVRARTTLMWAAFIVLIGAAVTTGTTWLVNRNLEAYAAGRRAERLDQIEAAIERLPKGAAYRLDSGQPRVAAVQSLLPPDVRGVLRDEVIAICVQRPELCKP